MTRGRSLASRTTSSLLVAVALVALGAPVTASADPTPGAGSAAPPQALVEAKAHFAQGKAFLDAKVYDKAIEEFEAAYKLSPFPELLFNVAQAYRLANQLDKALAAYQEFLRTTFTGELADEARTHVAELTKTVQDQRAVDTTTQQQQAAEHARQQAAYDADQQRHAELAHKRHVGHVELIISGIATAAGILIFATDPSAAPSAPIGIGLTIVGLVGVIVGGVTTAQGTDLYTPVPAPAPLPASSGGAPHAFSVGYGWRF